MHSSTEKHARLKVRRHALQGEKRAPGINHWLHCCRCEVLLEAQPLVVC
jgi:hypothetical protein